MRIELASLEGPREFAHTYAFGELALSEERVRLIAPATVTGEIRRVGQRAKVNGRLTARLQVDCDRCLRPVEIPVDSRFELEYVTPQEYQAQQTAELTEDDLDLSVFDGESVDVDDLVSEELLLAVPTQVLCKEDCKGICSVCGEDRNQVDCECERAAIDPRWAGLKELVKRDE
jgi:uncharacterized protein